MTLEAIQQEYMQLCAQVGEASYRIHVFQAEIQKAYGQMKRLNQQAAQKKEPPVADQCESTSP